jgi:lysophospholipid acyltransferase (LPLAT)-like uncharacterized protein
MSRELKYAVAARIARGLLDAVLGTARFEVEGQEYHLEPRKAGRPVVFVLWHGRLLPLTWYHRRQNLVTLISRSADGEYIARIVEQWGYTTVRGSSSRGGGQALREMVRYGRSGRSLAITPDGPRGPRQKVKPGALLASQLTGAPLIPVAASTERAWWFEGWDRFLVPKPFATIRVAYGPPIFVPRDADPGVLERAGSAVEDALNALLRRVDAPAGHD